MLAFQKAPRGHTDASFTQFRGTLEQQFAGDPEGLAQVVAAAKRQGYTPSYTDVYLPNLADSVGDPRAFVKTRGELKKVCEERGLECTGTVNVKGRERREIPNVRLADDIAEAAVNDMIRENPDLSRKNRKELKEQVIEKHGGK